MSQTLEFKGSMVTQEGAIVDVAPGSVQAPAVAPLPAFTPAPAATTSSVGATASPVPHAYNSMVLPALADATAGSSGATASPVAHAYTSMTLPALADATAQQQSPGTTARRYRRRSGQTTATASSIAATASPVSPKYTSISLPALADVSAPQPSQGDTTAEQRAQRHFGQTAATALTRSRAAVASGRRLLQGSHPVNKFVFVNRDAIATAGRALLSTPLSVTLPPGKNNLDNCDLVSGPFSLFLLSLCQYYDTYQGMLCSTQTLNCE